MEAIILISTVDSQGLIYKVSKTLFEHQLNIENNSEYVDPETGHFFMRTHIKGELDYNKLNSDLSFNLPDKSLIKISPVAKKNVVIMATKEPHVLAELLIRHFNGELMINIKAVIANHLDLKKLVDKFNIPFHFEDTKDLSRQQHEEQIAQKIKNYSPDFIVLAKYMRILTPEFVSLFPRKILNIHHSFLPAFIGANPYKQAHERGVKIIGATAHFVTDDLDEGPIITQDIVNVDHSYSWQMMRKAGRNVEKIVLSNALELLVEDRVIIEENKTIIL